MSHAEHDKRSESTAQLVKDLSAEVSLLVRQELALAKAELTEKGKKAGVGAGMLSSAAVLGLGVVGGSMAFFILLLDSWMPAWGAALVVTLVYAAVAGALALAGRRRITEATPPAPEQTIESLKEDVQWAKTRATSKSA